MTVLQLAAVALTSLTFVNAQGPLTLGSSTWVAPGTFPTDAFPSYYNNPTAISAQPQPIMTNPISGTVYPLSLTDPNNIPSIDKRAVALASDLTLAERDSALLDEIYNEIVALVKTVTTATECAVCTSGLDIAQFLARHLPSAVPTLAQKLCGLFQSSTACNGFVDFQAMGPILTTVLAPMDAKGLDGQSVCYYFLNLCPLPAASPLNLSGWFAKPKPANAVAPAPSGQRIKVLHLSDVHLDPRYATGSEADCGGYLCCRANAPNPKTPNQIQFPAPRYGSFICDTPYDLALSALEAIPEVTGTQTTGFDFSIFTGDLVSHDPGNEISQDYVEYEEVAVYTLFKKYFGGSPVYTAVGNHDTAPQAQEAPAYLADAHAGFSWNYQNLAGLWQGNGWISSDVAAAAQTHYGGYSVVRPDGLKIITINTDFWYHFNLYNYLNMTNPDASGILRFLTDELQAAEDAGQRVWIIGHVLTGWDGTEPLTNPTNLFYQIVDRFSPHVIANIFFGHTHEDHFSLFYANNGTTMNEFTAQTVSWIGPSITPLTNLNSGFRMYEVDAKTFDILDAHTWYTNVSAFNALDGQTAQGPTWVYEYSARETYGQQIAWPETAPLNATWWHKVTEQMESNPDLVNTFNRLQGKTSVMSPPCTGDCQTARICYMRSGSAVLSHQNCAPGFGTVQPPE